MLSLVVFLPALAALGLLTARSRPQLARWGFVAATATEVVLAAALWLTASGTGFRHEQRLSWIPGIGVSYHVGVDGISLALIAMTSVLFAACAVYSLRQQRAPATFAALMLALETTAIGVFAALDLIVFFLFFDLSLVLMYFVIAGWGHRDHRRAALHFFLYTFVGSLVLLLGFIGIAIAADPTTFDIAALIEQPPLRDAPVAGGFVLLAVGIGLAIKTPLVPLHTWLPPAHTEAPAVGSAILAGVLLKLGTYGFVRIALPILPDAWRRFALVFVILGVVSVLYGALVALAQSDVKRMIAYTSVNHMGYILLGLGTAGMIVGNTEPARQLAITGAATQMVSHGLITGALFLLAGVLYARAREYDMASFGGLAGVAPRYAGLMAVAAFAALGLPGFSGFIAEFHIFTGSLGVQPVATAVALLGVLLTAALFLRALHRLFLGERLLPGGVGRFDDVAARELVPVAALLALATVIGVLPRTLLGTLEPAAHTVAEWVTL
ncbi:NADH-quinone oxidoreductase subunit M [Haloechinothrix salitolerans]|uniref:NuoM family protein n=1 Tax=Haloechinothrix salitolerans TaxID=926830 RepID=A0ABW2C1R2_9PSEU